jgi:hypothetical protein
MKQDGTAHRSSGSRRDGGRSRRRRGSRDPGRRRLAKEADERTDAERLADMGWVECDWHGGLQVLSNLVNVFVGQGKLDLADRLLDNLQAAMSKLRDPFLLSSLYGQRGQSRSPAGT